MHCSFNSSVRYPMKVPTLLENDASGSGSDVSDEESESDESDEKEVIDLPSLSLKKEEESRSRKVR